MKGWLVGQTLPTFTRNLANERTINLFLATLPEGKVMINTPGLRSFGTLPSGPGRGIFEENGRCFAVGGSTLVEVFSNGTTTTIGNVRDTGSPAQFASNGNRGNQLLIESGGRVYIYNYATGIFGLVEDEQVPSDVIAVGYIDGYFVLITPDRFAISDLLDGLTWGADVGQRVGAPEDLRGGIVDHEVLWLAGRKRIEVWFNSGNSSFPFEPIPGVFLETGLAATHAICAVGDSIVWLGEDERGARQVLRNQGYEPAAISTPGIDAMLQALPSVVDARMFSFQMLGHTFAVLTIPSQRVTLLYDATEKAWTEWLYWNATTGQFEAHRAGSHCVAFGKHLVLDRETAAIHELSMDAYSDGAEVRRWLRRSPELSKEGKALFHHSLELAADMGVGLVSGQGVAPEVIMRYSDDGGMTWSNDRASTLGALGKYRNRPTWHALGQSRNRVYEFFGTDPVKTVLIDAYLEVTAGIH